VLHLADAAVVGDRESLKHLAPLCVVPLRRQARGKIPNGSQDDR
jgi:hypothetical protein